MKLEILLQSRNRFIYIAFAIVIVFLIQISIFYFPLIILYCHFIYHNHKDLIVIIIMVLIIYLLRVFLFNISELPIQPQYDIKVINNIKTDEYTSFMGKTKNQYLMVYFDEKIDVKPGEIYRVSGVIETPIGQTIPNGFSYKNYLLSKNIKNTIFSNRYQLISSNISINQLPFMLDKFISQNCPYSKGYIKTFLLADQSDIDNQIKSKIKNIGISHLFAVSGLHIALIVVALQKALAYFNIRSATRERIIIAILFVYLVLTAFAPSITRATLMYMLLVLNKRFQCKLSNLDILSLVFLLLLFQKPFYYYHVGFVLSFLVTFAIITGHQMLKQKQQLKQLFALSVLCFMITFPLIVNLNYQINLLSIGYNIFFLLFVTYLILPLGYITVVLSFLDRLYFSLIEVFEMLVSFCEKQDFFTIQMTLRNPIIIILYYLTLLKIFTLVEQGKQLYKSIVFLLVIILTGYYLPLLTPVQSVAFLDVEGDSTFISDRFNQCNILIDTGETDPYNNVIQYLKSKGVKRIDYIFISHFHSDHYGELNDILNEFKVLNVVSSQNLDSIEDRIIHCGNLEFFIYDMNYKSTNENENSLMLSIFLSNQHFLFVGDSEINRETEFISRYQVKIDVLKVGHHGSNTSSSDLFLKSINPKEAVIIVDRDNNFGHPSNEIIARYQESGIEIARTDLDGTVILQYFFGKEHKKLHRPS